MPNVQTAPTELANALAIAREHRSGVLVTHRREGRAQLSNIAYAVGDDDMIRISITADRMKAKNREHPDWDEYRQAMVNDKRLIARLTAQRAYGMWPS